MLRSILIFLFAGALFVRAQPARYPKIEMTDVAAAIYATGWEVEKEIIIRPSALPEVLRKNFSGSGVFAAADREALRPLVIEFFSEKFTVLIDGNSAGFVPDGVRFIEPDTENLVEISDSAAVAAEDFMIVVKSSAPLPSLDSTISFSWDYFPEGMEDVPVRVADTLGTRLIEVDPASGMVDAGVKLAMNLRNTPEPPPAPEVAVRKMPWLFSGIGAVAVFLLFFKRWKTAGAVGILAGGIWFFMGRQLVGERVSAEQAVEITDRILENVYHAFNISGEDAQYDQLEAVLDGAALESTFLEVRRTIHQRSEDGSRVRVRNVTVLQASPEQESGELGFSAACEWETSGQIGHWGHFHNRKNLYRADLSLAIVGGKWKATELDLNSRERE